MRVCESTVALVGLLIASPLLFLFGLLIKLDSPGPVFHRAVRVGRNGKLFRLYKFRTMFPDAGLKGPGITRSGDERVTRLGSWLRRTKMDELPQLINVILGEMSLVGPRPEDPRYVALYTEEQRRLLRVRPGLTSPASLAYRDEAELLFDDDWESKYCLEIMPAKLALDLEYLQGRTLKSDLMLIARSIRTMFQ